MWNTPDQVKALAPGDAPERPYHQGLEDTDTVWMGQNWLRKYRTPLKWEFIWVKKNKNYLIRGDALLFSTLFTSLSTKWDVCFSGDRVLISVGTSYQSRIFRDYEKLFCIQIECILAILTLPPTCVKWRSFITSSMIPLRCNAFMKSTLDGGGCAGSWPSLTVSASTSLIFPWMSTWQSAKWHHRYH